MIAAWFLDKSFALIIKRHDLIGCRWYVDTPIHLSRPHNLHVQTILYWKKLRYAYKIHDGKWANLMITSKYYRYRNEQIRSRYETIVVYTKHIVGGIKHVVEFTNDIVS